MRKIYTTLLLTATVFIGTRTSAQVSNYVFTQQQSSYVPISGGTVFATSTTDDGAFCNPGAPATNLVTGPGIPIGFTFTFNNTPYDVFGIDNNGWIAFGQSTLTPNPVNLNNTGLGAGLSGASTAPAILQNRVAGVGRDLVSNSGNLRVETIGATPNRVCVIQWTNYRSFGAATTENLNFQIRLFETSNIVNVVFGSWVMSANNGGQVGLRGNANTDFNNRNVTSPNIWATSIPGTVNTALCNWNTTGLIPSNGQVYEWIPPAPCTGAPASNSATTIFTTICPGGATNLGLLNTYTNTGISYQWYVSDLSAVGPFTIVPTATTSIYAASNITVTSWYQAIITCSNGPASSTTTPVNVMIASTTTNSVPYHEGFEGIVANNQLPNCSWSASSPSVVNQTYITANVNNRIPHSGLKYASFRNNTNVAGDYFYSNGVQLEPGITYSAAIWYITDGNIGWSELSMSYGSSQTSTGLTSIASVTGAVTGQFYQLLSNTFTVSTSGLYYIAIKCIGSSSPQFLTIDDLSITIPCSLNSPTMNVSITPSVVCVGQPVTISASGADTYNWSTGDQNPSILYTPLANMNISVVGTHIASGCTTTITPALMPNPSPVISVFSNSPFVCAGSSATLHAFGANSYTWSSGVVANSTTVAPTTATTYTVLGSNAIGCIGSTNVQVDVKQLPNVTGSSSPANEMCVNETATLTGNGALHYEWKNNSVIIITQNAYVSPQSTTVYTLTGTDINGCSATTQVAISVSQCTGINEVNSALNGLVVYPNPTNADFTIELNNNMNKQIEVMDVSGRLVLTNNSNDAKTNINIHELAAGIYHVKVTSGNVTQVIKVVKN